MTNLNKIEVLGLKYVLKNVHVISEQIASNKLIFESWVDIEIEDRNAPRTICSVDVLKSRI